MSYIVFPFQKSTVVKSEMVAKGAFGDTEYS
jgi:hypothetical protein